MIVQEGQNRDEKSSAYYDRDLHYRYALTRTWDKDRPTMCWIMLNPSTATELQDDSTIRRVRSFSKKHYMGGFSVVNLFAYRSTDPDILSTVDDAVGPDNDVMIREMTSQAARVVAAWGTHILARRRGAQVTQMLANAKVELMCLGTTKSGHPRHPLYVPDAQDLVTYREA